MTVQTITLHATTVALAGRGVLITGASGTGKSALGLELMAMGCTLVADDRTIVTRQDDRLSATCPATILGLIEARFVGLLNAATIPAADLWLAVDLDVTELARMPQERHLNLLGCPIPLLHKVETPYFAAAILQYLKAGPRLT